MVRIRVQEYELADLFDAFNVLQRIDDGSLEATLEDSPDESKRCSLGGESYYLWVDDSAGGYEARVHYVRCVFGHVIGRWPSALKMSDVTIHRQGHQHRPSR